MKTDIGYLKQLEADLEDAATRETARLERSKMRGAIRRSGRPWGKVAGVAAAVVLVAGAIGFFAQSGVLSPLSGSADSGGAGAVGSPVAPAPADEPSTDGSVGFDEEGDGGRGVDGQQGDLSKIVRDGRIGIVVADGGFDDAVGDLTFIAEEHGGFILSSSSQNERSGTFVLRIPASRFDRAITDVRDLAFRNRIRFQQIRGDDVTAEYIDHQARLRILRQRKALLAELSRQADTSEEILRFANQIDAVQLRIEQIQGQLRFLDDQIAESTLRVSIQERNAPAVVPPDEVENPDLGSAFALAYQGFLRIVTAVVVGLGYLVPLAALGTLVWLAVVLIRRRRAHA
jgi:Domain of unknown function (DUF4349)